MESSDSLSSQASSLPPRICENPEYLPLSICENPGFSPPIFSENRENLPPALPPKRTRTITKLNNLNATPPSSPKLILSESSVENPTTNNLSSQNINNTNVMNNNRSKCEIGPKPINTQPTSPSSNYVQISTSTINAAAAAEAANKQNNGTAKPEPIVKSNIDSVSNNVSESNAMNNDVRVIYTNVNILNSTNNRSSHANHYMQLCDESERDRKPNSMAKIDGDNEITAASTDNDRCSTQQNSSQSINNNNNSINDKMADEDVVVLRRPPASSNSSLKVLTILINFYTFYGCLGLIQNFRIVEMFTIFMCFVWSNFNDLFCFFL